MPFTTSSRQSDPLVDGGSFAAAADTLDISQAMVAKQIQKLDTRLMTARRAG